MNLNFINLLIMAYLLAALVLLHATLLFCGQNHCLYPLETPPVNNQLGYQLRRFISILLPFELKLLQTIAQWVIIGQFMLIVLWIIKIVYKIVWFVFWTVCISLVVMIVYMYFSSNMFANQFQNLVVGQGLITHQQIGNWTETGKEAIDNVRSYFK